MKPLSNYIKYKVDDYSKRISQLYKDKGMELSNENISILLRDSYYAGFLRKGIHDYDDDILWEKSIKYGIEKSKDVWYDFYDVAYSAFVEGYQTDSLI
jgi:hypothetical protein